jgi:hypothetical protein
MTESGNGSGPDGTGGTDASSSPVDPVKENPEPTVGTGSFVAIGCVVLLLVAVAVLAAMNFLPHLAR